jgi:hypothetical protein
MCLPHKKPFPISLKQRRDNRLLTDAKVRLIQTIDDEINSQIQLSSELFAVYLQDKPLPYTNIGDRKTDPVDESWIEQTAAHS